MDFFLKLEIRVFSYFIRPMSAGTYSVQVLVQGNLIPYYQYYSTQNNAQLVVSLKVYVV